MTRILNAVQTAIVCRGRVRSYKMYGKSQYLERHSLLEISESFILWRAYIAIHKLSILRPINPVDRASNLSVSLKFVSRTKTKACFNKTWHKLNTFTVINHETFLLTQHTYVSILRFQNKSLEFFKAAVNSFAPSFLHNRLWPLPKKKKKKKNRLNFTPTFNTRL